MRMLVPAGTAYPPISSGTRARRMNSGGKNRSSVQSTNQAGTEGQASREVWDEALAGLLRRIRGHAKTAIVSNAWPDIRTAVTDAGLHDLADAIILSCEVGYAKPDPRIYATALDRINADATHTLFIDDTTGHVAAAQSLGMAGHLHTDTNETLNRIEDFLR